MIIFDANDIRDETWLILKAEMMGPRILDALGVCNP